MGGFEGSLEARIDAIDSASGDDVFEVFTPLPPRIVDRTTVRSPGG